MERKVRYIRKTKLKIEEKGITVISLVVTIIVLLLLAGISISMLSGNNSILNRAKQAVDETKIAEYKEEISIALLGSIEKSGKANFEIMKQEIDNKGKYETTSLGDTLVIITKKDNCVFEANENGLVEYKGIRTAASNSGAKLYGRVDNYACWQEEYMNKITKVETKNYILTSRNAIEEWDASYDQDQSVMAWIESDGNEGYILYIAANGKIELPDAWNNHLFMNFENVKEINVSNFDVGNTTNVRNMFSGCYALEKIIGLEQWDTSNIQDMGCLFIECYSLEGVLDFSSWDISNVKSFEGMFAGLNSISKVIMPGANDKATSVGSMFHSCWANEIDISGITGEHVESLRLMFHNYEIPEIESPRIIDISSMILGDNITDSDFFITFGYTDKDIIYVKDATAQAFVIAQNPTVYSTDNVIIKNHTIF